MLNFIMRGLVVDVTANVIVIWINIFAVCGKFNNSKFQYISNKDQISI